MNIPKILTTIPLLIVGLGYTIPHTDAFAVKNCWDSQKQCCTTVSSECPESTCRNMLTATSCDSESIVSPPTIPDPVSCPSGQYGTPDNCYTCPEPGISNAGANSFITNCYIPAGTTFTDSTGTYEYTSKCYYTTK